MYKFSGLSFFSFFLLVACNNNDSAGNSVLTQSPYNSLSDSIDINPKNADLYYRRGGLLYQNNQMAYAEKDLRKAFELNPKEEYALALTTVLKQKNTDAAIQFLQEAVKKLPNSIALKIGLARGFQQKNQLDSSLIICNKVIEKYPAQLDALLLKSELLKAMNKDSEALFTLEKAYSYAPEDVEVAHRLCFSYADSKNPKALSLADSLIKADKEKRHAEPYYFKGVYYSNTGNDAEAIKQFNLAIEHDYYFINAYINKGIAFYDQKKYDQALKTFTLAATVSPTDADPYYWLAKTQQATGNKKDAKLNYQRAYGLDTTLTEAKEAADRL